MRNYKKLSTFAHKGTRLLLFVAMLFSLITSSLAPASVALAATNNVVTVTVQDAAAGPLAGRTVYVFDGTGLVYLGLFATTNAAGQVTFDLPTTPSSSYKFASDDVNSVRYFSPVCDVTSCTAATIVEPLFGAVTVTLTDTSAAALTGKTVYAFYSSGPTFANISKVTNGSGLAVFDLPTGSYVFGSDDVNNVRYYSSPACVVTGVAGSCGAASIVEPVFRTVAVTVQDGTGALANRVVYVYDETGATYLSLMATTGAAGEPAIFNVPDIAYQFASDDINGTRYFSAVSPIGATTATITEPTLVPVDVSVTLGGNPASGQIVYVFDGPGTTYLQLQTVSNAGGVAHFMLDNSLDYAFATDYSSLRYFSSTCVAACTAATIAIPAFGGVNVTVQDANGPLANRVVYVFDGTGTTYLNISGVTGAGGELVNFNLPAGNYQFASDDVNSVRYFSSVCTVPTPCTSAVVMEPVFGTVSVTVQDGALASVPGQTVYVFDGTRTTYQNLLAVTDGSGVATFNLPVGTYTFASDAVSSVRYFSYPSCTVAACASSTVILANVVDLGVTKTVDLSVATPGSTIVFTVVASNAGPNPATGVVVNDLLPAGVTYTSDDGAGAYVSASGVWTISSLAAGSSATLNITTTINAGTAGTTVVNNATVSAIQIDPWSGNESDTASVSVISATITDLCATTGTTTMPDGNTIAVWGYVAGDCTGSPVVTQPGGPTIFYNEGDSVSITLHNNLPVNVNTGLLFQGQAMIPDLTGVAPGGSKVYSFTATNPGTYLYEAGLLSSGNTQYQTAMGLYGAFVVYPSTVGQAYNDVDATTAYDDEAVLVLGEIDPALNNSAAPSTFDMRDFNASYFLINGKSYPATDPILTLPGNNVLLRYVNASVLQHSMTTLGVDQRVIAYDGSPLAYSHRMVAETFGPGQTVDVIVSIPGTAVQGTKYAVYDGNLMLRNSNATGFGGMLTFINVGTPGPGTDVGPQTSGMGLSPNPSSGLFPVTLSATVSDAATGGSNVAAAEYFVDAIGANGSGTAMSGTFSSITVSVSSVLSPAYLATLSLGNHTLYVHGQDANGNWGSTNFITLKLDRTGPITKILYMTPNPTNGSVLVALSATGDDRTTGNSNVTAAQYFIDSVLISTPVIATNGPATIVSLNVAFPVTSLSQGTHTVSVRSMDVYGNWGPLANASLVIDKTGPVANPVSASPNPTNGRTGINSTVPAVRLTATLTDTVSNIKAAEGFIGTVGVPGTGFLLIPKDGLFNSLAEVAYVDIPFSTIAQLADGNYTISVRGKDASGNWGPVGTTVLVINRTLPDLANIAIVNNGARFATLTADANNAVGSIALAEWFIGSDPGQGNAARAQVTANGAVAKLAASINVATRPNGTYTVYVRAMDAAGNWSSTKSSTLIVNNVSAFVPPEPGAIKRIFIPSVRR